MIPGRSGTCRDCAGPARTSRAVLCAACAKSRQYRKNALAQRERQAAAHALRIERATDADPLDLPGERWAPIPGWEGLYEISSFERVRSCPRRGTAAGLIRKPVVDRWGTTRVTLSVRRPGGPTRYETIRPDRLTHQIFGE